MVFFSYCRYSRMCHFRVASSPWNYALACDSEGFVNDGQRALRNDPRGSRFPLFFFFFLVTLARETVEDRFACRGVRRPRNIVVSQRINPKTRTTLGYRAAFSRRSFTSKLKDDLQVWSVIWGREEEVRVEEDSCNGTVNGRCLWRFWQWWQKRFGESSWRN